MILDLMIELAWKSAVIAGAGLGLAWLVRGKAAAVRAGVLRAAVLCLLALPVLCLALPALHAAAPDPAPLAQTLSHTAAPIGWGRSVEVAPVVSREAAPLVPPVVLPLLWAAGGLLLVLRLLAGLAELARWTRAAQPAGHAAWPATLDDLARPGRSPRLGVVAAPAAPLSWGWPGVILLSPAVEARAGDARAVLAHELAHVRRGDWPWLMAARLAVALFWFNPLAWRLLSEMAQASEEAADAWAARRMARLDYAAALVGMAGAGHAAALGMGGSPRALKRRIKALLSQPRDGGRWAGAAAVAACLALATPLAALELTRPQDRDRVAPTVDDIRQAVRGSLEAQQAGYRADEAALRAEAGALAAQDAAEAVQAEAERAADHAREAQEEARRVAAEHGVHAADLARDADIQARAADEMARQADAVARQVEAQVRQMDVARIEHEAQAAAHAAVAAEHARFAAQMAAQMQDAFRFSGRWFSQDGPAPVPPAPPAAPRPPLPPVRTNVIPRPPAPPVPPAAAPSPPAAPVAPPAPPAPPRVLTGRWSS